MMNKTSYKKSKVLSISTGHFLHDLYSSFLAPMLPLLIDKLGISLSLVGLLDVIRRVPSLINPFIGAMADRTGLKYMIILTPAVTGISMSFLGIAPNYSTIAILLFVAGLSAAFFHVASPVLVKRYSGNNTAKSMGYYMFGGEIARTLGPLLITAVISWWSLEGSYRVIPIGIIASIILYFQLRNFKYIRKKVSLATSENRSIERKKYIPLFTAISGFLFFNAGMKAFLTLYLVVYLTDKGNSLWLASISLSVLQLSGAAGSFFAGYITEKISYKVTLLISSIASPILMLSLFYFNFLTIPLLILVGFTFFVATPIIMAVVQEQATKRPAFLNSIYMTLSFVINSLMVLLVGVLSDFIGMDNTMLATGLMAFVSIAFVFLFPEGEISTKTK